MSEQTIDSRGGSPRTTVIVSGDQASDPLFLVLHAVRLKGTCDIATVTNFTGLDEASVTQLLDAAVAEEFAQFREGRRGGYRLSDRGRDRHRALLGSDTEPAGVRDALEAAYAGFLPLNDRLKSVCADWQLRGGQPNDHSDPVYDAQVIDSLAGLNEEIGTVLDGAAGRCERLVVYARRFDAALARVQGGDTAAFARPLAHSYHDAWMELHQDFLLSLGRERDAADGY